MKKSLLDRFHEKVRIDGSECWIWMGATTPSGYGMKWDGERVIPAHRWAYMHFVSSIPEGLQLDHLCRVRNCVNPAHLEPVTSRQNALRGSAGEINGARQRAITACPQGHVYDDANTYWRPDGGGRQCRRCTYERNRAIRLARRAQASATQESSMQ